MSQVVQQFKYNDIGAPVAQTIGATTTNFALDVVGLPEVICQQLG